MAPDSNPRGLDACAFAEETGALENRSLPSHGHVNLAGEEALLKSKTPDGYLVLKGEFYDAIRNKKVVA